MKTKISSFADNYPEPKWLFRTAVIVYTLLIAAIISACLLIKYPVSYKAKILTLQRNYNPQIKVLLASKSNDLKANDQIFLKGNNGIAITAYVNHYDKKTQTLLISIAAAKKMQKQNILPLERGIITIVKQKQLFLLLIEKLN